MKKLTLASFFILSGLMQAHAASIECQTIQGHFQNDILAAKKISIESPYDSVSFLNAETLVFNALGKDDVFKKTAVSTGKTSKIDFTLNSNPEVRAILLIDGSLGRAEKKGSFRGLLVLSGTNITFNVSEAALYTAHSLIYNVKCSF